jgi:hypothetical protein
MQLFIKTCFYNSKNSHVVEVKNPESTTIEGLKTIISNKIRMPPKFGIRTMSSSQLDESRYISDYNIQDMHTIQVVIPIKKKKD